MFFAQIVRKCAIFKKFYMQNFLYLNYNCLLCTANLKINL